MPSNDDFRFFSRTVCAVTLSCLKKLAGWCRHALILASVSESGEKYSWSWDSQRRAPRCDKGGSPLPKVALQSFYLVVIGFFHPSPFLLMLSSFRCLDVPICDSLVLIAMMSRWAIELCSVSWERWHCDTSFGSQIVGFMILSSYALYESNRNDSPAHSVVDCKALMAWQFESQLLSWCSSNCKAW